MLYNNSRSLLTLPKFWIILPILLYFLTRGNFLNQSSAIAGNYVSASNTEATVRGRAIVAGIWLISLLLMSQRLKSMFASARVNWPLFLLPALAFSSSVWSVSPGETVRRSVFITLSTLFALYIADSFTPEEHIELFYFVSVAAVGLSFLCIIALPSTSVGADGWKGIFGHKNDLGVFVIFVGSTALFRKRMKLPGKLANTLLLVSGLTLVAFSQSRTGWLLVFVYVSYYVASVILARFQMMSRTILLLAATVMAIGASIFAIENYQAIAELLGKDSTLSDRTAIWGAVLNSILKHPILGYGYGAFWHGLNGPSADVIIAIHFGVGHAHNGFLNVWLEVGILGVIIVLLYAIKSIFEMQQIRAWTRPLLWYLGLIVLTIASNLDESYLFNNNDLSWMLFVLAVVQIHQARLAVDIDSENWKSYPNTMIARTLDHNQTVSQPISSRYHGLTDPKRGTGI